jgi:hypothetical protein
MKVRFGVGTDPNGTTGGLLKNCDQARSLSDLAGEHKHK